MAALPIVYREPATIGQGTTISFTRNLKNYPASAGWSLLYSMRGGVKAIEFISTANIDEHVILVPAVVTESWQPGDYELQGQAVNVDGTKAMIYLAPCVVVVDESALNGNTNITTHAQRMLASIEVQLERLACTVLDVTDVEGTRIQRVQRMELYKERAKYIRERQGEINTQRAKAGLPNRRKIVSRFNITTPGTAGVAPTGAGPDNPFNYWP
jgi:hypothetical protein